MLHHLSVAQQIQLVFHILDAFFYCDLFLIQAEGMQSAPSVVARSSREIAMSALDAFVGRCRPQRSCKQAVRQTTAVVQLPVSPKVPAAWEPVKHTQRVR